MFSYRQFASLGLCAVVGIALVGCDADELAHRKSVAKLNQQASELLAVGDAAGAASRLEAALALTPGNGLIQYNLGIAYQQAGDTEKAIATLDSFLEKHPSHDQTDNAVQTVIVLHQQAGDTAVIALDNPDEQEVGFSEPATKEVAIGHYQQALQGLAQLREKSSEEQFALIDDNVEAVSKKLAKLQGNAEQAGEAS